MLENGFEHAYMYGEPRNSDPKRYRLTPKCCQVSVGFSRGAGGWRTKSGDVPCVSRNNAVRQPLNPAQPLTFPCCTQVKLDGRAAASGPLCTPTP